MIIIKQNKKNSKITTSQSNSKTNNNRIDAEKENSIKKEISYTLEDEYFSSTGYPAKNNKNSYYYSTILDGDDLAGGYIVADISTSLPSSGDSSYQEAQYSDSEIESSKLPREDDNLNYTLRQDTLTSILSRLHLDSNDFNIEVLSHESVYFENTNNKLASNQLFNSLEENSNQILRKIKENEITKSESIFDRFVLYADVSDHSEISNKSYKSFINIVEKLDQTSLYTDMLEKQINYGNIVNDSIIKKSSILNGKIFKTILSEKESFLRVPGKNDERLLDKQIKIEDLQMNSNDLEIFYENICGFKIIHDDNDFKNSFQNTRIINSDRIVGQMMLNTSLSLFSLYPNTDNVLSRDFFDERQDINSSGLNLFPIIQVGSLNRNSKIFNYGRNSLETINIKGSKFSKTGITTFRNARVANIFKENPRKRIFKNDEFRELQDQNINIERRRSLIGNGSSEGDSNFDNATFRFNVTEKNVFETIYTDIKSFNDYRAPTFLMMPERYLGDDSRNNLLEGNGVIGTDQREFLFFDNETIPTVNEITSQIKSSLFSDFTSSPPITGSNVELVEDIKNIYDDFDRSMAISYRNCFKKSRFTGRERKNNFNTNTLEVASIANERILEGYFFLRNEQIENVEASNLTEIQNRIIADFEIEQNIDNADNLIASFDSSISSNIIGNSNERILKNDIFIFSSSNSILSKKELSSYLRYHEYSEIVMKGNEFKKPKKSSTRFLSNNETIFDYVNKIFENSGRLISTFDNIFSIIKSSNAFKRKKIENEIGIFKTFVDKSKSKVLQEEKYSLLYSPFEEISFDTFENSKFIDKEKFYKNNFTKEFSKVENTTKSFIKSDVSFTNDHIFSSKEYRAMLSKLYTKSFMRSKTSLFKKVIIDNIDIMKNSLYSEKRMLGFDLLLANSLLNKGARDDGSIKKICKMILSNAIIQESSIENQASSLYVKPEAKYDLNENPTNNNSYLFSKNFKKIYTKDFVDDIVNHVFSQRSIIEQDSYILRVTTPSKLKSTSDFNITTSKGVGGVVFKDVPGALCNLYFPFKFQSYSMNKSYLVSNNFRIATSGETVSRENGNLRRVLNNYKSYLRSLSSRFNYNHDIFISEERTGISFYGNNSDNEFVTLGYDFNDKRSEKGTDLNICHYVYDQDLNNSYKTTNTIVPFSYFYLSKKQDTFSNKLTDFSKSLLQIFDANLENINNIDDVFNFIDQNEFYLEIMQNIFEFYSGLFLSSIQAYQLILIDKIANHSLTNNDFNYDSFENKVEEYTFSGNSDAKLRAISDLQVIIDSSSDTFSSSEDYSAQEFLENENELEIYSRRLEDLREVSRLLKNSDLAEAFSHDIIHGYFLNFEDNMTKSNSNLTSLNENLSFLEKEIKKIRLVSSSNFDLKNYIFNEFYQNIVSKRMSEISFYKNIYNETFTNNNIFLSEIEKYKNVDAFGHRRLYYENKLRQATSGYEVIKKIVKYKSSTAVIDFIKFPIHIDSSKIIGDKGIIQINIQPVNLQYPEIKYKTLTRYYTSTLTDVSSNFSSFVSSNDLISNFIGFYNSSRKISDRYVVVDKETAKAEMSGIVYDIFKRRQYTSEGVVIDSVIEQISNSIVKDMIVSNAIKKTGYVNQQAFDDSISMKDLELNNLVGLQTVSLVSSLGEDTLNKMFKNFNSESLPTGDSIESYDILSSEKEILENNEFYKKFIINLDKDTTNIEMINAMIPKKYYDVFSVAINKETIEIENSEDILRLRNSDFASNTSKNNSFAYYISAEVLQWILITSKMSFTQ